ncbi:hypothetical protein KBZ12_16150 [Cyanobium sp. Cruz CV13-4-11]|jgi:hypothetical protein|nr:MULTISPECIES: hypothetical protein [unclassified Cyanobium]MCP9902134.1 hypothetical protein [Cyanobium sp. Cruz CV11-17]MCP9920982.1 hypothetical protein [Cyanobium sp. Cruz CV13-4-11]
MDVRPSRVFMDGNSQALLDALAGFEPSFVAGLEDPAAMGDSTQAP